MKYPPPKTTPYEIKRRQRGVKVWAVQRALNRLGNALVEDGFFGALTEDVVIAFQMENNLGMDGVFGQKTSLAVAQKLAESVAPTILPGLLEGLIELESGGLIAAVNWTVPGGVDCGYMQRRVYFPMTDRKVRGAFDGKRQMEATAKRVADRFMGFAKPGRTLDLRWRLAALDHNYPSGAARIAAVGISGLSSYWTTPQQWVIDIGAQFPDFAAVQTPLEWCQHYALGSPEHGDVGMAMKYAV